MSNEPVWLTKKFVLSLHAIMIDKFGGIDGVRDEALLESALAKPQNHFSYGEESLHTLAAAYAIGIVKNHPFLDGNKRTGFMAVAVFLDTNGKSLNVPETEATQMTLSLASGDLNLGEYALWLEENS